MDAYSGATIQGWHRRWRDRTYTGDDNYILDRALCRLTIGNKPLTHIYFFGRKISLITQPM
jgi:hypothetical protein